MEFTATEIPVSLDMATPLTKKSKTAAKQAKPASAKPAQKEKLPPIKEQIIVRPSAEQLDLLEKAIYHSFRMTFAEDATGASGLVYNGVPVKPITGNQPFDLKILFDKIVTVYRTL